MNVLVIGDLHAPFIHRNYFNFVCAVKKKYHCKQTVFIGDITDNHTLSDYIHNPDGFAGGMESNKAEKELQIWYEKFPKAYICIGNHDERIYRNAMKVAIPKRFIKDYSTIWNTPKGWIWDFDFEIEGVIYRHGHGKSGRFSHVNWAIENRQSTVIGHCHSNSGIQYLATKKDIIFGMNVGCGINIKSYIMEYGKNFPRRPILSCGVVIDGKQGIVIPMSMGMK